jgi:hypothetical protein
MKVVPYAKRRKKRCRKSNFTSRVEFDTVAHPVPMDSRARNGLGLSILTGHSDSELVYRKDNETPKASTVVSHFDDGRKALHSIADHGMQPPPDSASRPNEIRLIRSLHDLIRAHDPIIRAGRETLHDALML